MALDIKDDWPLLVGGLLVVFAIMYALNASGSSSNATVSYQTVGADPAITAEETSMYAAKQQTAQTLITGVLGLASNEAADNAQVSENATTTAAAETTALAEAADSEESTIIGSGNQLSAITTEANDQLSASQAQAHAAQQNGFWNALFGGLSSLAPGIESFFKASPTSVSPSQASANAGYTGSYIGVY